MSWYIVVPIVVLMLPRLSVVVTGTSVYDISCSFENDFCGWSPGNWNRTEYPNILAQTERSGPKQAKDESFYIYLDTSTKNPGSTFTGSLTRDSLMLPAVSGDVCLRFWYHMFGETMGSLNVRVDDDNRWSRTGNQNNTWHCAAVDLISLQAKISFEASMGSDIYSIIALDNIEVLNTNCNQENCATLSDSTTVKTVTTTQPTTSKQTTEHESEISTSTTPTQINLQEYIPIIAGVPAAILVVGAVILIVCLRRQKLTKPPEPYLEHPTPNQYDQFPNDGGYTTADEVNEEVYAELDEEEMIQTETENKPNSNLQSESFYINPIANNDYEEPDTINKPTASYYSRTDKGDYITATNKRSDVASTVYSPGDDDYITPTNNENDGPKRLSSKTDSIVVKYVQRTSNASSVLKGDDSDYLDLISPK